MSDFCQHCKVLQFDDSICGGHMGKSDTSEAVLSFADDQMLEWESEAGAKERVLQLHYGRRDILPDMPGLKKTADAGCQFCSFLRRSIQGYLRNNYPSIPLDDLSIPLVEFAWIKVDQGSGNLPSSWKLELRLKFELEKRSLQHDIRFGISTPQGALATWLSISQTPPTNDAFTPEKVSWINDCISECTTSCSHKQLSDSLPTRLIYVGDRTGDKFGNPRLVITSRQETMTKDRPKYAILSYCWGTSPTLKTEQANLEDHLKEIPLESMPATCRDAVLVTRAIGIEWLWIDALCIIQGDKEDWEKEASRMADAYANAFITIIPLRSNSSSEGFLSQRPSRDYVDVFFDSVVNPNVQGTFTIRKPSPELFLTGDLSDLFSSSFQSSDWFSRGWTFQEFLMSFRRLCFGDSGIFFECQNMTRSDNGESMPERTEITGDWINEVGLEGDIGCVLNDYWYLNMTGYSGRSLSFQKDILPAVSAIATVLSDKIGDKYLCGLWRSDLPKGLSWTIASADAKLDHQSHINKVSSQEDYIGPSWSWINPVMKQQYIEWDESTAIAACDIIEAESVVEGKNPFGCIQSAHILIRGRSRPLPGPSLYEKVRSGFKRRYWTTGESGYFTAECELDWYVNEGLEDVMEEEKEEEKEEEDYEEYPGRRVLTAAAASWLNDLVMVFIGQDSEDKTMNGLMLVQAKKENEWYRVGVFRELSGENEAKDPFQNWETCTFKLV